jgi:hypothetical protein
MAKPRVHTVYDSLGDRAFPGHALGTLLHPGPKRGCVVPRRSRRYSRSTVTHRARCDTPHVTWRSFAGNPGSGGTTACDRVKLACCGVRSPIVLVASPSLVPSNQNPAAPRRDIPHLAHPRPSLGFPSIYVRNCRVLGARGVSAQPRRRGAENDFGHRAPRP